MTQSDKSVPARIDELASESAEVFKLVHEENNTTGQRHADLRQLVASMSAMVEQTRRAQEYAAGYYGTGGERSAAQ